jgi:hypothetical protein
MNRLFIFFHVKENAMSLSLLRVATIDGARRNSLRSGRPTRFSRQ